MIRKLKSQKGETIGETLAAIIIVTLALTVLAGAIVTSSRINKQISDDDTSFDLTKVTKTSGSVVITHDSDNTIADTSVTVNVYTTTDGNEYVYYSEK